MVNNVPWFAPDEDPEDYTLELEEEKKAPGIKPISHPATSSLFFDDKPVGNINNFLPGMNGGREGNYLINLLGAEFSILNDLINTPKIVKIRVEIQGQSAEFEGYLVSFDMNVNGSVDIQVSPSGGNQWTKTI